MVYNDGHGPGGYPAIFGISRLKYLSMDIITCYCKPLKCFKP